MSPWFGLALPWTEFSFLLENDSQRRTFRHVLSKINSQMGNAILIKTFLRRRVRLASIIFCVPIEQANSVLSITANWGKVTRWSKASIKALISGRVSWLHLVWKVGFKTRGCILYSETKTSNLGWRRDNPRLHLHYLTEYIPIPWCFTGSSKSCARACVCLFLEVLCTLPPPE